MIGPTSALRFQGRRALVTGASSGIGEAIAEELARRGCNLVLVARSMDVLEVTTSRLRTTYGVDVEAFRADLMVAGDRGSLVAAYAGREIDVLVNNAGIGIQGRFEELSIERQLDAVELNCAAVVELTHAFVPGMLSRRVGGIVNVASTAAFQSTPMMATYGATKAFVLSFSQALAGEYRRRGVRVLAFCPGPVQTNFSSGFTNEGLARRLFSRAPTPASIAPKALDAFDRGRTLYIPGGANQVGALSTRLLPRSLVAAFAGRLLR